jgi:CheY-like chemotaxis protein
VPACGPLPPHKVAGHLQKPIMTGAELLRTMRSDPSLAEVGFVLIASQSDSDPAATVSGAAHTALLSKPFDRDKLGRALAAAGASVAGCPGG